VITLTKLPTLGSLQWRLGRQLLSRPACSTELTVADESNLSHPSIQSRLKRAIDLLGAIVGLVLTAFLIPPIAIAIYLDNPGPILYSQQRCGLYGRPFRMWKFRSMVTNAEALQHLVVNQASGNIFKNDRDPRITPVGQFLRRTSLDELPQFWNVLMGEMSLVGTRPPTLAEVEGYSAHHWLRLNVKPGMTGEWQANGRSYVDDFEQIVKLDLRYQQRWSIAYDLYLVSKTIFAVLQRKGAY
jgi:lipopolysaccharide/colanic/teichoic acid biosynthesis glycosyltransferase